MNAQEKNALIDAAKAGMNVAIAGIIGEVFSGLTAAGLIMIGVGQMIRATGDEDHAVQAELRAAEVAGILAIPWPFIYIGSNAWIAAVAQLRDSLPQYLDLEPVDGQRRRASSERVDAASSPRPDAKWSALSNAQRSQLEAAGIDAKLLRPLG